MKKIVLFLMFSVTVFAQEHNPKELLGKIQNEFEKIKDYSVDIDIKIDVNFVDAPPSKAKLFFKQPDKIKIKSDGFAIIPKQGLSFSPSQLLTEPYSAIFIKTEVIDSFTVDVLKVVPLTDSSNIILSTLWIDPLYKVIRKIESVTKKMGTITVDLYYNHPEVEILPSKAKFFFNVAATGHAAMFKEDSGIESNKEKKGISGTVIINYSNYKLNQNLPDSLFVEEE